MTLLDYQTQYNQLLLSKPFTPVMLHLLCDWSLELIRANDLTPAEEKVREYGYRAFLGNMQKFEGYQFFSFRGFSSYSVKEIKTDKLSVSHPEEYNDPLDTVLLTYLKRKIQTEKDPVIQTRYCMLLRAAHHLRMRCFVRTTPLIHEDGKMGEREQDVQDINPLMWAHYAQYHKGFCIKYELDDKFVKYDEAKKTFTRMAILKYCKDIDLNAGLTIGDALLWKNAIWDYEQEVRVIHLDYENKEQYKEIDAPKLKAIYLGLKCSDSDRHDMEMALRGKQVDLYQMKLDESNVCKLVAERIG